MEVEFRIVDLIKRYPLRISRGEVSRSNNLFISLSHEDVTAIGECAPGETTGAASVEECQTQLEVFLDNFDLKQSSLHDAWQVARDMNIATCAYAGLDIALWDLLAKQCQQPLYRLLGLPKRSVPTSVTLGIVTSDVVRERLPEILTRTGARYLKVKLGNPEGVDTDQAMFNAVVESVRKFDVGVRVDANGGWSLRDAQRMMSWLAERGVEYIEQPLAVTDDQYLPQLYQNRSLPIYIDESCNYASDVVRLSHCVDGVNLKLMKCGGITEALRIVATARAHGLKTMIGCMGESSIAISAGAAIGALFDYIDLDSQLNLLPDPAAGAQLVDGVVVPLETPGHGGRLLC